MTDREYDPEYEPTIGIYVPSYKRANRILSYHLFEKCTYMVRKSQADDYLAAGIAPEDLWAVDDQYIDCGSKAYMYIVENAQDDIIVVCDDDVKDFVYLLDSATSLNGNAERITAEIERLARIVYDLGIGHAFLPPTAIPYNYTQEFAFKGIPGAVKFYNRGVFKAKLDRNVSENFDIDLILQELLTNRICLQAKYFVPIADMDTNAGGNSDRVRQDQIDSITNMKAKWGKYFQYDFRKNKPTINVAR